MAGIFLAKTGHQLGAVRVGQFNGVAVAVLPENAEPPAFDMTFYRYDAERERRVRDFIKHLQPASVGVSGNHPTVVIKGTNDLKSPGGA